LIRPSFVPPAEVQALRDLTRTRKQFIRERSGHVQRIDKLLQAANLKLSSVLCDILGQGGRAVLDALAAGESDPERLADQIRTKVKASRAELLAVLRGRMGAHQRVLLRLHLAQVDAVEAAIAELDREVGERLEPFCRAHARLSTMPGLGSVSASAILSEIGVDMSRFPTPAHLVSWAGLCPRNDESAGKRRSTRLRHGAPWLKTLLVQAAWAAVRVKASYYHALFQRLRARRGAKKAIVAVAASMLTAIHVMLARGLDYRDLGADHFERSNQERLAARLTKKLKKLGYAVALTPISPSDPVPC
jgi:transposase